MLTIFKFIRSARTKVQRRNAQTYEIGWENALKDCRELNLDPRSIINWHRAG